MKFSQIIGILLIGLLCGSGGVYWWQSRTATQHRESIHQDEELHHSHEQGAESESAEGAEHEHLHAESESAEGAEHEHLHAEGELAEGVEHEHLHAEGEEHGHNHETEAGTGTEIALSEVARKNLRLEYATIELRDFEQTTPVPGMIVERPGRSTYVISAPMNGRVERIYPITRQTVTAGTPLFDLRMTHEDLVVAQTEYLETFLSLEVVGREVERLRQVAEGGAVAGRTMLEQQYQMEKLQGIMQAQRQQLLLHGLTDAQIDQISKTRSLISTVTIVAPPYPDSEKVGENTSDAETTEHTVGWQVSQIQVSPGQHVLAGETLAKLYDATVLYVEGKAFEQDIPSLERMFRDRATFVAVPEARDLAEDNEGTRRETITGLTLASLADRVDPTSRAFLFYAELHNQVISEWDSEGRKLTNWKFRQGQRLELRLPTRRMENVVVLPAESLVQEGADRFILIAEQLEPLQVTGEVVFEQHPVRVLYRDRFAVVIENDGELPLGRSVATRGSYQIHLAIRNQSGNALDPHAGHNH